MQAIVALLLLAVASVNADCENSCSGHGDCGLDDVCTCYQNWGVGMGGLSGDCSERICPYDIAFVDGPDMNGEFHKYAECSGRGLCDRNTGECQCFDGYNGQGCQRATCPNDCSGHGTCEFIEDLTFGSKSAFQKEGSVTDELYNFPYYGWDKGKNRACKCDAPYGDYDCSKRMCPHGNDVMDTRLTQTIIAKYHEQTILFKFQTSSADNDGKTFAISVKSDANEIMTTDPIVYQAAAAHDMGLAIASSIKKLPLVDYDVRVTVSYGLKTSAPGVTPLVIIASDHETTIVVEFVGCAQQGDQNFLTIHTKFCGDGCTPKLSGLDLEYYNNVVSDGNQVFESQNADYNNYECGRHGKCDYESGECTCYNGFSGKACSMQTSLQ
jgi:hypothetical protein